MIKLVVIVIALIWSTTMFAQWESLTPATSGSFSSVSAINSDTVVFCGYNSSNSTGIIQRTADAGNLWQVVSSGYWCSLRSICFVNDSIGYACGGYGSISSMILKTINGGLSWNTIYSVNYDRNFSSIFFTSADTGYIASTGCVVMTTDGGNTLTDVITGNSYDIYEIFFPSKEIGYAVGEFGNILKTTTGGMQWTILSSGWGDLNAVYFLNNDTGFVAGYGQTGPGTGSYILRKTINGGISWSNIYASNASELNAIFFVNDTIGYIGGEGGKVYKTVNGGANWLSQSTGTTQGINSISFYNEDIGYLVGNNNVIKKTVNGGLTWADYSTVKDSIKVFPNPVNDKLIIDIEESVIIDFFNIHGQIVNSKSLTEKTNILDISNLTSGVYTLRIKTANGIAIRKLIKQ